MMEFLMLLLIIIAVLNAMSYSEGGSFLNLYVCVLNTAMFLILFLVGQLK